MTQWNEWMSWMNELNERIRWIKDEVEWMNERVKRLSGWMMDEDLK